MFPSGRGRKSSGDWRGRGGYSAARRGGGQGWRSNPKTPRVPSPPLGPILREISCNELDGDNLNSGDAKITGVKDVASYNWIAGAEPTILVPGCPPKWTPSRQSTQLREDEGIFFRDPNAARFAAYPIEPVVRSVFETHPNFQSSKIDLFGCGSTLGNLLRFVRQDSDKPFRFLVEVVGKTVFFIRRENSPREVMDDIRGYGHTFPEAYTTWDIDARGSDSHQRIIRYHFGGLNILIRFEGDGYLADKVPPRHDVFTTPIQVNDGNSLASALAENTITRTINTDSKPLKVNQGQWSIPQSAVLDLKTRTIRKKDGLTLSEQLPRLWLRQIPFFVLAYHERGLFRPEEITVQDVTADVATWEQNNKQALCRLASLINQMAAFAKATPEHRLEVRYVEGGQLELRKQCEGTNGVLPEELAARWAKVERGDEGWVGGVGLLEEDGGDEDYHGWDEESEKDFTACSAEDCGYCGHCTY